MHCLQNGFIAFSISKQKQSNTIRRKVLSEIDAHQKLQFTTFSYSGPSGIFVLTESRILLKPVLGGVRICRNS